MNVGGTTNVDVHAFQFGYTFTNVNWANPLLPTNNLAGLDFIGLPLTRVSVTADTNTVAENDGSTHRFTITRTGDTNADLRVNIAPLRFSGTATPGADYILDSQLSDTNDFIIIPAGSNSIAFTCNIINDTTVETAETINFTLLSDSSNMDAPTYALGAPAEATITILDDDAPVKPIVTLRTTTPGISEDGMDLGQLIFTRSGSTAADLFVNYSTSGTATMGTDYVTLSGVVLIPAGQSSATVAVQTIDDKNVEPDETVVATISTDATYTTGSPSSATINILDDDFMTVTISPTSDTAAEPGTTGKFTVKRDGDLTEALVVTYNVSGTATAATDYTALSGTLTIPAGAASADITLTPLDDALLEGPESVTVVLTNSVNYDVGTPGSATLLIRDDEKPLVTIATTQDNVSEQGDQPGQFTLTRTGTSGDLTIYLAVSGTATSGADYVPIDNPVVIPDGSSSVTLDVIPFHDLSLEPTETVKLTVLTNANYNVGSGATASLNILDDGTGTIPAVGFCFASSAVLENESPGIAVSLSITSAVPVLVDYRVIGGTAGTNRYSLAQGTLTLTNQVAFVPLKIVNDSVAQAPQTIRVALFNPVNATLDSIKIHTYTILDDDTSSVSVAATTPSAAEAGLIAGNFRITRTGSTNANQPVNFQITGSASAPTDYAPLGNSAVIPAGATFVDLPVIPTDDNTMELAQTVVLTLTSATNANLISPNVATVTIADNDTNTLPVVTISSTNQPYALEGGANGEFVFTRSGPTTNALTVLFTVSGTANNGGDYATITNGVTFAAGQASVSLSVAAVDDSLVEGDETVILSLTQGTTYRTAYPAFAQVTIQDNDQSVWVDASDFTASESGHDLGEFTFSRFGTTNTPVTIFYTVSGTASNGVDYAFITNAFTIPAGQVTATLPVVPLDDTLVEGAETVTLTLQANAAYALGQPTNATVTINDDEPMLTISAVVTNVMEGSSSNGVFRLTRTGDPKYDFTAYLAIGGTSTFGVDYPAFATNIYFSCGIMTIDLLVTPTNEVVVEGDETVTAAILPNPAYSILSPSNAVLTITDVGTNQTPSVTITNPHSSIVFLVGTNVGLVLNAAIIDDQPSNTLSWFKVSGPDSLFFESTNTADTTVTFTNSGFYTLRLTADDGQLQGHADLIVVVSASDLSVTNILHWPLDELTGTNAADTSGYARDGLLNGPPVWTTNGIIAGALDFAGTNDCVRQVGGSNLLNGLTAFTVSLWVKPAADFADRGLVTADDSATNETFSLITKNFASCGRATNVVEVVIPSAQGAVHRISASGVLTPGQWQHVAVTWTNQEAPKLYFNGQVDQPLASFVTATGALMNCSQFVVGKGGWGSVNSWHGAIDDVRVFDRALSGEEILAIADSALLNKAPVVNAGPDVATQIGVPVTLTGIVTDDGKPNPPGAVTNFWAYLGTNNITITNPASLTNTFVFDTPGTYVFRLTAFDGELTTFDDVTITVLEPTQISIYASDSDANELGPDPGEFTVTRTGDTNEMTVYLTVSGTASNAVDYVPFPNTVTFAAGADTTNFAVLPILDDRIEGDESVIVAVATNLAYSVSGGPATVTIHDSPYGLWSIQQFTLEELTFPNISGAAADWDHDTVKNFAEYAFNLDPKSPDANPPYQWGFETNTNDNKQHLTLTYTRRLPPRDVEYGVFVSTDLINWNSDTNYVEEFSRASNPNGFTETVKVRALQPFPSATNLFMNIRVWLQQVPAPAP